MSTRLPRESLPFLRFLLRHTLVGIGAGWLFVALLLALDIAGLRSLMLHGSRTDGLVALVLLVVFSAITFGSAAMGAAIMGLAESERGGKGMGKRARWRAWLPRPATSPVPVPVPSPAAAPQRPRPQRG